MREETLIAGRYELRAPLGRGAMAEVWEGYDPRLDRRMAVKFIRRVGLPSGTDYDKLMERFAREARITAKLEHPGVPTVYDVGTHEGEAYLAMQLVTGHNLDDVVVEQGPLPVSWVVAVGAQLCSVLAAAHAASLVHRDLKPRNLMLCPDGTVKVLDFGIAAALDAVDLTRLTTTGHSPGTPTYMAPEQATGGDVGHAADLYALGCVLHELLAGTPPFVAETPMAVLGQHLYADPPALRAMRPDVPASLEELMLRLLAKEPGDRPDSAAELYPQLSRYVAQAAHEASSFAELGPTRPYHFPFGPLPVSRSPDPDPRAIAPPRRPGQERRSEEAVNDLNAQRERAVELVDQGRVTRAGEVLGEATRTAAEALGTDDPEVVDARLALAHVYLLADDHRRALPELQRLLPDLHRHYGPDHDLVRGARRGVAGCHAALGDRARARSELEALLAERGPHGGPQDAEMGEIRAELRRLDGEVP